MSDESMGTGFNHVVTLIFNQLSVLNEKVDKAVAVSERVAAQESQHANLSDQVDGISANQHKHALEMAEMRGSHKVILWMMGLVGAPIAVALILAGIAALFGIKL